MSVTEDKFDQPDIEGTVTQLADHMPDGDAWEAKLIEGSNLHAQMHGTSKPFNLLQGRIEDLARDFDIDQTTELVGEWETSVGLPDSCLGAVSDIDERRALIKARFQKKALVTLQDLQDYVDSLFPDDGVILVPGFEFFNFEFDLQMYFLGDINDKFILVATLPPQEPFFEFDFEFDLTGGINQGELRCVLERVIPANVYLLILERDSA